MKKNDILKAAFEEAAKTEINKLPEEEKEYDRNTSQETLRLILKLGYKIVKE